MIVGIMLQSFYFVRKIMRGTLDLYTIKQEVMWNGKNCEIFFVTSYS